MQKNIAIYEALIAREEAVQPRDAHPPYYLELELTRRIAAKDEEGALRVLAETNRAQRATLSQDPLRSLKNSLIGSCTLFTRSAIVSGAHVNAAFALSDICIRVIESFTNIELLYGFEEEMLRRFIAITRELNDKRYSGVVRQCIDYVSAHLLEPLTVDKVAKAVYVHPAYLSARFKRDTGEALTHYIQRERISEAQRMLRRGQETVAFIAGACQFCSQSYFIQVFKRHTGLTPEQFRHMEGMR